MGKSKSRFPRNSGTIIDNFFEDKVNPPPSTMAEAKAIKKHSAQHDLFNRIHSIAADEKFVRKVAEEWYAGRFEVVRMFSPYVNYCCIYPLIRTKPIRDVVIGIVIRQWVSYGATHDGYVLNISQTSSNVYAYFKSTDGHTSVNNSATSRHSTNMVIRTGTSIFADPICR